MYLVYVYNPYGTDKMVGYVETEQEFLDYCKTLGLEYVSNGHYGKRMGDSAYFKDVHYIQKIAKAI